MDTVFHLEGDDGAPCCGAQQFLFIGRKQNDRDPDRDMDCYRCEPCDFAWTVGCGRSDR